MGLNDFLDPEHILWSWADQVLKAPWLEGYDVCRVFLTNQLSSTPHTQTMRNHDFYMSLLLMKTALHWTFLDHDI